MMNEAEKNNRAKRRRMLSVIALLGVIGAFIIVVNCSLPGEMLYNAFKKSDSEWTLEEAQSKGQVKLDFRKNNDGQFMILPFQFEYGLDRGHEIYFKNEGPNNVGLTFEEVEWFSDKAQDELQSEFYLIEPNGEIKKEFFNKTLDENAKFWVVISDTTGASPVIYGDFYIV